MAAVKASGVVLYAEASQPSPRTKPSGACQPRSPSSRCKPGSRLLAAAAGSRLSTGAPSLARLAAEAGRNMAFDLLERVVEDAATAARTGTPTHSSSAWDGPDLSPAITRPSDSTSSADSALANGTGPSARPARHHGGHQLHPA